MPSPLELTPRDIRIRFLHSLSHTDRLRFAASHRVSYLDFLMYYFTSERLEDIAFFVDYLTYRYRTATKENTLHSLMQTGKIKADHFLQFIERIPKLAQRAFFQALFLRYYPSTTEPTPFSCEILQRAIAHFDKESQHLQETNRDTLVAALLSQLSRILSEEDHNRLCDIVGPTKPQKQLQSVTHTLSSKSAQTVADLINRCLPEKYAVSAAHCSSPMTLQTTLNNIEEKTNIEKPMQLALAALRLTSVSEKDDRTRRHLTLVILPIVSKCLTSSEKQLLINKLSLILRLNATEHRNTILEAVRILLRRDMTLLPSFFNQDELTKSPIVRQFPPAQRNMKAHLPSTTMDTQASFNAFIEGFVQFVSGRFILEDYPSPLDFFRTILPIVILSHVPSAIQIHQPKLANQLRKMFTLLVIHSVSNGLQNLDDQNGDIGVARRALLEFTRKHKKVRQLIQPYLQKRGSIQLEPISDNPEQAMEVLVAEYKKDPPLQPQQSDCNSGKTLR